MGLTNKLVEVFPTRPLKVMKLKQEGSFHQIRRISAAIILFVLAVFIGIRNYPGLIDDYKISRNPVVVNYDVEGTCRAKRSVDNCSVKITTDTGQVIKRDYTFIGGKKGNYQVVTIASADDPSLVTIDLAIENMRTVFVATTGLILLLLLVTWMSLGCFLRTHKMAKVIKEINGQKLTPVIVPVKLVSYGKTITALYRANNAQGINAKYAANFNKDSNGGPIIIGDRIRNKCNVLAVVGESNSVPILLDQEFTRCDFTYNEMQALKEALS
ncbi:hypothetical protein [Gilliamella sp. Pas-s25]|uniref:hypothetical protein n=1 Tax=Gilliamella sp. Pas-s25 TaxID=2687310 RepID=UPI00135DAD65|nr:hypothetical protein [Gilliamella sp. Pas-s25]MWP62965.1 hypothetical protein [Gilliamella sp. Pas-s25]